MIYNSADINKTQTSRGVHGQRTHHCGAIFYNIHSPLNRPLCLHQHHQESGETIWLLDLLLSLTSKDNLSVPVEKWFPFFNPDRNSHFLLMRRLQSGSCKVIMLGEEESIDLGSCSRYFYTGQHRWMNRLKLRWDSMLAESLWRCLEYSSSKPTLSGCLWASCWCPNGQVWSSDHCDPAAHTQILRREVKLLRLKCPILTVAQSKAAELWENVLFQ